MEELAAGSPWVAVAAGLAGVGSLVLAAYLRRHSGKPGANWFVVGLATQAVFCLAAATHPFAGGVSALVLATVAWTAFVATGPLFFAFAMEYTGRGAVFENDTVTAVLALSSVNTLVVATAPLHGLVWEAVPAGGLSEAAVVEPLGFVTVSFGTALAGVGVLVLVETVVEYGPLYRREATAVALSTVAPTVVLLGWLLGVDARLTLTAVAAAFVPHVLLDGYAFVESGMFETNPATRRAAEQSAVDDIATPVFVLDEGDRIVEYNRAAASLATGTPGGTDPLGSCISEVLETGSADDEKRPRGDGGQPAVDGGQPAADGTLTAEERLVTTRVNGDHRQYRVSRSPLTDPGDDRVGATLVFEDVTRERRREQRLDVLNRVLRHNLRNRMTTVMGHAELIEREADDDRTRELAGMIDDAATDMVDAGEKAREFERLRESGPRYRSVEVEACLADAVDGHRERAARIDVTADSGAVRTDPRWVRLVVSNLVENAVDHVDEPAVSVTATVADDGELRLTVSDDGDGIPAEELDPLRDGETPLAHGTGIGLWVVEWSVRALGGEWTVEEDDGTVVTVRLPGGEDARVADDAVASAVTSEGVAGD